MTSDAGPEASATATASEQTNAARPATPARRSVAKQLAWAALAVGVGMPLCLGAWIGLVVLGARLDWPFTANEIFAWLAAALVALVLWPITAYGAQRQVWHFRARRPDESMRWGAEPTAPVPKVPLTVGERWARAAILFVGAAALLAICGPQQVTLALLGALDAASAGARSWWLALQFGAFLLMAALIVPVLWLTDRRVRRLPADSSERTRFAVVQAWYLGAAIGWVMSAVVGFVIALMIVRYL
ncbi:hypothetical protein MUN74_04745 [Agromyces endophyticus]|uniref:hypothetical protein n=1 Tax=Agromyces sp. H17E-10 TaxID=2932244 RepID=UPI001FD5595D|nr:hypothetical protein [Agromyces sp. H17E-10]UOQ90232.1 hypothetical protein MUN74_04745 [Agromyces sp. H17E-10]